jgi:putative ABC transport system permease protein
MMVLAQSFWVGIAGIAVAIPTIFLIAYFGGEVGAKVQLPFKLMAGSCAITMTMAMLSGLLALRSLSLVEPVTLLR